MTKNKGFKARVRARMQLTGEDYTNACRALEDERAAASASSEPEWVGPLVIGLLSYALLPDDSEREVIRSTLDEYERAVHAAAESLGWSPNAAVAIGALGVPRAFLEAVRRSAHANCGDNLMLRGVGIASPEAPDVLLRAAAGLYCVKDLRRLERQSGLASKTAFVVPAEFKARGANDARRLACKRSALLPRPPARGPPRPSRCSRVR